VDVINSIKMRRYDEIANATSSATLNELIMDKSKRNKGLHLFNILYHVEKYVFNYILYLYF